MVDSAQARGRRRRSPMISPVLRPKLWSALIGMVATAALTTPAWADPLPDSVPDAGLRPPQVAGLRLPGVTPVGPGRTPDGPGTIPVITNPADGPLIAQINQADALVAQLGDTLLRMRAERDEAQAQLADATAALKRAQDALTQAREKARVAAADAVKAAAAIPPGEFGADLRDLNALQRIIRGDRAEGATTAVDGEVARATAAQQTAEQAYDSARRRATEKATQYVKVEADLHKQEATLVKLRKDNAARLLEIERLEDAAEQRLGSSYIVNQSVSGLVADPKALAAVRYALAQLGDPYLWAAEGPDRFDCSGLVLASYQAAGYHDLPRVSRDQYYATRGRTVGPNALLPGDLLFFASGSGWPSIHHVAMYIGNGKMVEAPRTGDVVKISVVRWSRLFAATRVIGAVPAPTPSPTTKPKPSPTPTPTRTVTPQPTRTPTPQPTRSSPSPTPSATTSPSSSPTPSPAPGPSDSTAPSPTATTSAEPSLAEPSTSSTGTTSSSQSAGS